MKKLFKALTFITPLLFISAFPAIVNSEKVQKQNIKTKYDPKTVYDSFEFTGYQSIEASKQEKYTDANGSSINPSPWYKWTDFIKINKSSGSTLEWSDFVSFEFSLTGKEVNKVQDAKGTLGAAVADTIETSIHWGKTVRTTQRWINYYEDKEVSIDAISKNKNAWKKEFAPGTNPWVSGPAWSQIMKKIPKEHTNNIYESVVHIKDISTKKTLWEELFLDTNDSYLLDYSRKSTYNDDKLKSEYSYNGRDYSSWFIESFEGVGNKTFNAKGQWSSSRALLEYDVKLIDDEGTKYPIKKLPSQINPNFDEFVNVDKTLIQTNDKESRIGVATHHLEGNLIDPNNYDIQVKVNDSTGTTVLDWLDIKLSSISTNINDPYRYSSRFNKLFNLGENYSVYIRDNKHPDTVSQSNIKSTELINFNKTQPIKKWIWILLFLGGALLLFLLIWGLIKLIKILIINIYIWKNTKK